jgi:hypothetical protein
MSREYHLVTRDRPGAWAFARTLTEAVGHKVEIDGDFEDPDGYLNVSAFDLWIEVEPPGHVEAIDLKEMFADDVRLPHPDEQDCLWYTTANVPAGAPPLGADVIWRTFTRLAKAHHGIAIDPQLGQG